MLYDVKCKELAQRFLADYEPLNDAERVMLTAELAERFQNTADDFLQEHFEDTSR